MIIWVLGILPVILTNQKDTATAPPNYLCSTSAPLDPRGPGSSPHSVMSYSTLESHTLPRFWEWCPFPECHPLLRWLCRKALCHTGWVLFQERWSSEEVSGARRDGIGRKLKAYGTQQDGKLCKVASEQRPSPRHELVSRVLQCGPMPIPGLPGTHSHPEVPCSLLYNHNSLSRDCDL